MRIWRLLVEVGSKVWTYVVAAGDHEEAWRLVLAELPGPDRERASLEELEATSGPSVTGWPRIVHVWQTAPALSDQHSAIS